MTVRSVSKQPVISIFANSDQATIEEEFRNVMPNARRQRVPKNPKPKGESRRPTLPQIRKTQTRAHLLDSARGVFSAHGYELASVAQIADAAGLSKGALYVHFESKEALFRELLVDHVKRRSAATAATLEPDLPLREAIMRIIEGAWAIYDEGDPCSSLSTEFFALAGRNDWGREAMASIFDHCSTALIHFLDQAKEHGQVREDLNSSSAAQLMLALQDGLVMQWQNQPKEADPKNFLVPMAEMILSYIEIRETAT